MGQIGGWPMSMPMDHPRIGKVQQGGGGGAQGMPAGASPTAEFQEQGAASGSNTPSGNQMLPDAVVASSPMARPQYIAPMQNHGGGDGHVNHGGAKIKGGEQTQNTKHLGGGSGGDGGFPVSVGGPQLGGIMTPSKNAMTMKSNMIVDPDFFSINQMSGGPMTMGMPMEHLHIPIMQQGGGGGGAYEGMSAGGKNTPSGLVQANMAAGQQQRGMPSGTEVVHDAAAAVNPRAQQQYMAAVVARVPMARPQYITPMQNHGGRDGHMNYGGGKIRGGEQPQNTKQFVAQGGSNDASGLHVSVISSPLASGMTPMARPQYIGPMQKNSGEDGQVNYSRGKIKEGEQMQNTKQCVTPGVVNDLPTVSVSGPLPGGTTPPKNVRYNTPWSPYGGYPGRRFCGPAPPRDAPRIWHKGRCHIVYS
jgi:hypothetical protein